MPSIQDSEGEMTALLQVKNLRTSFFTQEGEIKAVNGIFFDLFAGEALGVVGESGCGKSVTALSIMRLVPHPPGRIIDGQILFNGRDLLKLNKDQMRRIRGKEIAMIFQDPMISLNPVLTIQRQITESLELHLGLNAQQSKERCIELLKMVGIPSPEQRINDYPHQFSGGMRQRVMIAIALACSPRMLIADEPTTALDVTIQAQIVDLVKRIRRELGTAVMWITHDLGVVAGLCDRVIVMYAGRIVEFAPVQKLYALPSHPYTLGLLHSIPRLDEEGKVKLASIEGLPPDLIDALPGCAFYPRCVYAVDICRQEVPELRSIDPNHLVACWIDLKERKASHFSEENRELHRYKRVDLPMTSNGQVLLEVKNLQMHFPLQARFIMKRKGGVIKAVDGLNFSVKRGETLGVVGESGCGKSTTGRAILQLYRPTAGKVFFEGIDLCALQGEVLRKMRRKMQMIFQDPYASLNPRMTVGKIIAEPLEVHGIAQGKEREERVKELLRVVGLNPYFANRYPHEFSGGQRQRIGVAHALAVQPAFIVCDEPVSALDVSIQAQTINLLEELQDRFDLTYLFIAHDLSVVRHISDRVAVMYLGKIVELADRNDLYQQPLHPYTRALLSAVPIPDPAAEAKRERILLTGDVMASPIDSPPGCRFRQRCWEVFDRCRDEEPQFRDLGGQHWVACHRIA